MDAAFWIIAISAIVTAVAFVVLVVYAITTISFVRKVVEAITRVGGAIGKKVCSCAACRGEVQEKVIHAKHEVHEHVEAKSNVAADVVEWAVVGLSLWQQFKDKRRKHG